MSRPLTNAAHSGLVVPPPKRLALGVALTRPAHLRAMAYASDGMAPTAVAMESIKRRLTSWTTGCGRSLIVNPVAYSASRRASVWDIANLPASGPRVRIVRSLWSAGREAGRGIHPGGRTRGKL